MYGFVRQPSTIAQCLLDIRLLKVRIFGENLVKRRAVSKTVYDLFVVRDIEGKNGESKGVFTKIGVLFPSKGGNGLSGIIDLFGWRIVVKKREEKREEELHF